MRAFHARQGAWGGECAALGGAPATAASAGEATSLRSSIAAAVARRCARRQAEGRPNERRCIHLSRGTCAPGRRAERLLRATRSLECIYTSKYFFISVRNLSTRPSPRVLPCIFEGGVRWKGHLAPLSAPRRFQGVYDTPNEGCMQSGGVQESGCGKRPHAAPINQVSNSNDQQSSRRWAI